MLFVFPHTRDDERVRDAGLLEHVLDVAGEERQGLAFPTVRVEEQQHPAGTTHLTVHDTWREREGGRERERERQRETLRLKSERL